MDFHVIYSLIAIILAALIFAYSWRHSDARGSREFAILCVTAILWMTGVLIGNLSTTLEQQYLCDVLRFAGVMPLPVALFTFTRRYCGRIITAKQVALLCIIPAVSFLLMATTYWHGIFFYSLEFVPYDTLGVTYGKYFWFVHTPYSYSLILISIITVLLELTRTTQRFRSQIAFLFLSICFPFVINFAHLTGVFNEVNLTPAGFLGFMIVSAFGIYRYQFLSTSPIAYETVFKTSRDGVVILDQNNIIADMNPTAGKVFSRKTEKLIGKTIEEAVGSCKEVWKKHQSDLEGGNEFEMELGDEKTFYSVSTTPIDNGNGILSGQIITIRNITTHKEHQTSLETLAFHDPLTMLANRRKFQEEFQNTLKGSKKTGKKFAILYFDLNSFKAVNDSLGHDVGDELLKYVAARIASILRTPDILARLGGDEFAAILHNTSEKGVETAVERIMENIQTPFRIKNHTLVANMSVGAAFYPEHGKDLVELLRHADTAMYRAKSSGTDLAVFDSSIDSTTILNM